MKKIKIPSSMLEKCSQNCSCHTSTCCLVQHENGICSDPPYNSIHCFKCQPTPVMPKKCKYCYGKGYYTVADEGNILKHPCKRCATPETPDSSKEIDVQKIKLQVILSDIVTYLGFGQHISQQHMKDLFDKIQKL